MKRGLYRIISLVLFLLGISFIINSEAIVTGAVVAIPINATFSSIFGFILILISGILFALGYEEPAYQRIAAKVYEKLGHKDALGHHTENIEGIVRAVGVGDIKPKDVREVIINEIKEGRLNCKNNTNSISISEGKLEETMDLYGNLIESNEVKERLEDKIKGRHPVGYRG